MTPVPSRSRAAALALSCTLTAALAFGQEPSSPAAPPNVVLFLVDDLGYSDPACFGHPFHETPHIDALAAEGLRFTDFYAASPVCSSTRASIQAGQYPARVGITDFIPGHWRPFEKLVVPRIEDALPGDAIDTPGELARKRGYATAWFGKWHLGGAGSGPGDHGYDAHDGTLGDAAADRAFEAARGNRPPGPKRIDLLTDRAIWFLERNRDRPFFLALSHHAVHIPVEGSPEQVEKYRAKPRPRTGVNDPFYAAMVADTDASLGRIVGAIEELGIAKRTIVMFTSDNGGLRRIYTGVGDDVTTNAPLRDEKGTLYEGGIRVPLIVRWPGVTPPGGVCAEPSTTADLLPTWQAVLGLDAPRQPLDGASLEPLLRNPGAHLDRAAVFFHYPHYHHGRPAGAIRAGRWKLIENFEDGSVELYDLASDVGEELDLAVRYPDRAATLRTRLARWREAVGARMPRPNPDYDPERAHEWWSRRTGKPVDVDAMERAYRTRRRAGDEDR